MWRLKVLLSFVLVLCAWTQISAAAQHDYVIDNAPGATVRADINSSLQAIVTNNSGATEPSTTYPNMWWYDTSTSLLKRRNNANDAWIKVGLEAASTDGTFAANSDSLVPTQKAAKTYADTKVSKSTAAEIYNVTEKATPAANDVLLLEDSAASYAKKSVKISNIRQSIDAILPTQTGNSGKYLTTNGSASSWGSVVSSPITLVSTTTFSNEGTKSITGVTPTTKYYIIEFYLYRSDTTKFTASANISNNDALISTSVALAGGTGTQSVSGTILSSPSVFENNSGYELGAVFTASGVSVLNTAPTRISSAGCAIRHQSNNAQLDRIIFTVSQNVYGTVKIYALD